MIYTAIMDKEQLLNGRQVMRVLDISHPTFLKFIASKYLSGQRDETRKTSPWFVPVTNIRHIIELKQREINQMIERLDNETNISI